MPYATQADMEAVFGSPVLVQLTGRGTGALDASVLERAFSDTDALIDSYLAERYTLPLVGRAFPVRPACDIAMYYLRGTKVDESAQVRYDQAIAFLRDVARGTASLPLDGSGQVPQGDQQDDAVQQVAGARIFSPDTLADY